MINGVQIPGENNRGRAFPFKNDDTHFVGPAIVDGKLFRISVWLNTSKDGRPYVRIVFEDSEEASQY